MSADVFLFPSVSRTLAQLFAEIGKSDVIVLAANSSAFSVCPQTQKALSTTDGFRILLMASKPDNDLAASLIDAFIRLQSKIIFHARHALPYLAPMLNKLYGLTATLYQPRLVWFDLSDLRTLFRRNNEGFISFLLATVRISKHLLMVLWRLGQFGWARGQPYASASKRHMEGTAAQSI